MITSDIVMRAVLAIGVIAVGVSLIRFHRSARWQDFCLVDLLMENGRVSKFACILMGSFLVTTWIVAYLTVEGKLTEGYLTIYVAAWITPSVAKLIKGNAADEAKGSSS